MAERRTREQKTAQTRERILAAAERVFAEKGYLGAAVDDVAAAAGLTKGGVYAHFRSKEALYLALARKSGYASLDEIEEILAASTDDLDVRIKALTARIIRQLSARARFVLGEEFLVHASRNPRLRKEVREAVMKSRQIEAELIKREWDKAGIQPAIEADHLSRLINGIARELGWEIVLDPKADVAHIAERTLGFLIRAARESHRWS